MKDELIEVVHLFMTEAVDQYGDNNLCQIAQYVREYIELYDETQGWVVLIGSNNFMASPSEFASKLNYISGTYLRYTFQHKLSVEIFRPRTDDEPLDKEQQSWLIFL